LAGTAALVGSCARYTPKPLIPAATATTFEARTLDAPRLREFIAKADPAYGRSGARPWDVTTLTLAALYYHPDLDIAHAKLSGAQAAVITARQRPNPVLSLTNLVDQAVVPAAAIPGAVPITVGPVIDFVLESFGKREYRTAQAQHLVDAARWGLATAGWEVRGRVRTALLNLWAAQRRLTLSRRRLALQEQLVGLLEQRFAAGEASSLDVARERINRAQIALAIRDLERAAADARVELATAIGIPVTALNGVEVSLNAFDRPPPLAANLGIGELRREALTRRTDVQASLREYEAAQSALQLALANQYPNLTLSPGYNYDFGVNKYILGGGAELPILHQNQGAIAEAMAGRDQAAARFGALQAQIVGAIDQAATAYRTAIRSVATGDGLLGDEERRERQVAASFLAGGVDRPTLVTTELEVAATGLARFDAVVQQRQAIGALEDALQQPLFDPGHSPLVPERAPRGREPGA
jgi:outer membrane protein TolC